MIPADIQLTQVQAGTANSDRPETGGEAWRSAWQKEMERLQAREWFGHGIVGSAASPLDQARLSPAKAMPLRETQGIPALTAALARLAPPATRETVDAGDHAGPQADARNDFCELAGDVNGDWGVNVGANPKVSVDGLQAQAARSPQSPAHPPAIEALLNHLVAALPGMLAPANAGAPGVDVAVPMQRMALPPAMAIAPSSTASSPNSKASQLLGQAPSKPAAAAQQQPVERQGVRLHAEWTSEGVRLWLGMDVSAAVPPAMLFRQLQRSVAAHGMRLLSLTCNGALVPMNESPESTPTTEMEGLPWQSTQ